MNMLMGFAPFFAFALVEKMFGAVPGLACGAFVSVLLLLRDRLHGEHEINILEAGSALMFTALTVVALLDGTDAWSVWRVRLWVDGGLMVIVLFSIAVGRPFTMQHARHQVSPEVARDARFLRTNRILSGVWAVALLLLCVADLLMVLRPYAPVSLAVGLTLAALAGAVWFTRQYAAQAKAAARARAACRLPG